MTRDDLVRMSDSDLHEWCLEHDLCGCRDGDCGASSCIWCGEEVYQVLDEITKKEDQDDL